jgi:hypothetical protein
VAINNSGNILFAAVTGKAEGTAGVAASFATGGRKFLAEPTGLITIGKEWDLEPKSIALRNQIVATNATLISSSPEMAISFPAVSIDDMSIIYGMAFDPTISGTAAPYTWTIEPSLGTASNAPTSFSFMVQDAQGGTAAGGNQYLLSYVMPSEVTLSFDRNSMTSLSANFFAQNIAESTATVAASTVIPSSKFLSGRLWNIATGTALATGTFTSYQYALDASLTLQTGIVPNAVLAGTTSFSTHSESGAIGGELTMTVQSNAAASAKLYQKLGQQQFIRLSWTDGTNSATVYTSVIISSVEPISGSEDGLTVMAITGTLAVDPVTSKVVKIVIENSVDDLP